MLYIKTCFLSRSFPVHTESIHPDSFSSPAPPSQHDDSWIKPGLSEFLLSRPSLQRGHPHIQGSPLSSSNFRRLLSLQLPPPRFATGVFNEPDAGPYRSSYLSVVERVNLPLLPWPLSIIEAVYEFFDHFPPKAP